jgi:hypothetical protein
MKCLCELSKKDIEKQLAELSAEVARPAWICRNCARASSDRKRLCKPVRLKVRAED